MKYINFPNFSRFPHRIRRKTLEVMQKIAPMSVIVTLGHFARHFRLCAPISKNLTPFYRGPTFRRFGHKNR